MKLLLFVSLTLMSSLALGIVITEEEYNSIRSENKAHTENVEEGMTAEYHKISRSTGVEGGDESCIWHRKEEVLSAQPYSDYLVYVKDTHLIDCYGGVAGQADERLEWRKFRPYTDSLIPDFLEIIGTTYEAHDNVLQISVKHKNSSDGKIYDKTSKLDVTKSQFYQYNEFSYLNLTTKLLNRSVTDINTIIKVGLPIYEVE